jgi:hypothetical protein
VLRELSEWFRLFASAGKVYEQRLSSPQWETYPTAALCSKDRDKACLNALLLFLDGYAFERAGCPPYFRGLAVVVLTGIGTWPPDENLVWERFQYALSRYKQDPPKVVRWTEEEVAESDAEVKDSRNYLRGLATKVNPLAPKGTHLLENGRDRVASQVSIVWLARGSDIPLDMWVRDHLQEKIQKAHSELVGVSGIGDKIASYFMRDVACHYGIFPLIEDDEKLLQPIDIWERRTVRLLRDGKVAKDDDECRSFIVQSSNDAGFSPERVNQGIWYFCSQIAETEYYLHKAMTSPDGIRVASHWLKTHLSNLKRVECS